VGFSRRVDAYPKSRVGGRRAKIWTALSVVAVVLSVLAVSSADAAVTHPYTGTSFGPDGVGGSQSFENVGAVAVEPGSGDLYVYDAPAGKIYKFDSAGAPVSFSSTGTNVIPNVGAGYGSPEFELAIAPPGAPGGTEGDIYLAYGNSSLRIFNAAGEKISDMTQGGYETCGVATDPSGNLYVAAQPPAINKYVPTENPPDNTVGKTTGKIEGGNCNIAVDGAENIYGANPGGSGLYRITGIHGTQSVKIDPSATTLAVASGSGNLYADSGTEVRIYDAAGTKIGSFAAEGLSGSRGVATNSDETKVYVAAREKVRVYGAAAPAPEATTEAATTVTKSKVTLNGTISAAGGPDATCAFQYVSQSQWYSTGFEGAPEVPCNPAGPFTGSSSNAVSAIVTGLTFGSEYHYRLVGEAGGNRVSGGTLIVNTVPAVNLENKPPTNITSSSATLNGAINPEGEAVEECYFQYYPTANYEPKTAPCAEGSAEIGTGNTPVPVHADITGLKIGEEYAVQLIAKDQLGTTYGQQYYFKAAGASVYSVSVGEITEDSAVFSARVNPNGVPAHYQFEYVTAQEFQENGYAQAAFVPAASESLGSATEQVEISQTAGGLAPGTVYHVRLSVVEPAGTTRLETTFSTYIPASLGLSDGRAYEEVTPATALEKNATTMEGNELNVLYASPDGSAVTYYSITGAGDINSSAAYPIYSAHRGSDSWTSATMTLPAALGIRMRSLAYTENLTGGYTEAWNPGETDGLYLQEADGHTTTIAQWPVEYGEQAAIAAESQGEGVLLFESNAKLTSNATAGVWNVFAWNRSTGALTLVSEMPGGGEPAEGASAGPWNWVNEYTEGGSRGGYYTDSALNREGTKAFFTTEGDYQIYMRTNPTSTAGTTTLISASQKTNGTGPGGTDPNGPKPATFLEATPSGSYVFFKSHAELTNDANTGPEDEGEDLYRYDTATGQLIDLTPYEGETNGARVLGISGVSDDGSYAYFVARGNLAAGANPGEKNLFVWHDGQVKLVANLRGFEPDEEIYIGTRYAGRFLRQRSLKVTPDGKTIAFMSGYERKEFNNREHWEVYRWEYENPGLHCVSCNPSGIPATSNANFQATPEPFIEPTVYTSGETRNLSANGKRVFFSTPEKLVAADTNEVEDVYEWEADGEGSCTSTAQNGGCLYLISTGTSPERSYFSDASTSGNDVFFFTGQQLVGQDQDEYVDEYDARVGGGLASQNPVQTIPCEGQACRGSATTAPGQEGRGTSTFNGPGNPKPTEPTKKKHKHKKHKKKHKHRKHKKKKGHKKGKGKSGRGHGKKGGKR
jgi:hypothetical protein